MSSKRNVPASAVREWFATLGQTDLPAPGKRGRVHAETAKAFNKAHKSVVYVQGAVKPTVTIAVPGTDKRGRNITRKVTITTAEARALLGQSGVRGRFNKATLTEAYIAANG